MSIRKYIKNRLRGALQLPQGPYQWFDMILNATEVRNNLSLTGHTWMDQLPADGEAELPSECFGCSPPTSMPTSTMGMGGGIDWYVDAQISINTCLLLVANESSAAFLMPP